MVTFSEKLDRCCLMSLVLTLFNLKKADMSDIVWRAIPLILTSLIQNVQFGRFSFLSTSDSSESTASTSEVFVW